MDSTRSVERTGASSTTSGGRACADPGNVGVGGHSSGHGHWTRRSRQDPTGRRGHRLMARPRHATRPAMSPDSSTTKGGTRCPAQPSVPTTAALNSSSPNGRPRRDPTRRRARALCSGYGRRALHARVRSLPLQSGLRVRRALPGSALPAGGSLGGAAQNRPGWWRPCAPTLIQHVDARSKAIAISLLQQFVRRAHVDAAPAIAASNAREVGDAIAGGAVGQW